MSVALAYEDAHSQYDQPSSFSVTNEGLEEWKNLLKGISVSRAAGICSGGEIGLITLLPCVKDELVLIDHSYRSMLFAMVKYVLIKEKGPKKTKAILSDRKLFQEEYSRIIQDLPIKTKTNHYDAAYTSHYKIQDIETFWKNKPNTLLWRVRPKLDRVRFIHGDLTDLIKEGPFDLLYLSNALQHMSRERKHPPMEKIKELVKPGSYVMLAGYSYSSYYDKVTAPASSWELCGQVSSCGSGSWRQQLWQVKEK